MMTRSKDFKEGVRAFIEKAPRALQRPVGKARGKIAASAVEEPAIRADTGVPS